MIAASERASALDQPPDFDTTLPTTMQASAAVKVRAQKDRLSYGNLPEAHRRPVPRLTSKAILTLNRGTDRAKAGLFRYRRCRSTMC